MFYKLYIKSNKLKLLIDYRMFYSRIKIQKIPLRIGLFALFLLYFKGYSHSQVNLGLVGIFGFSDHIECLEMHEDKNEYNINGYNNIYAFCGTGKGLTIIKVTDPNNTERVTHLDLGKVVAIDFFEMHVGSNKDTNSQNICFSEAQTFFPSDLDVDPPYGFIPYGVIQFNVTKMR